MKDKQTLESALFKHLEKIVADNSTLKSIQSLEIIVAFSGGLDSSALLHAAFKLLQSGQIAQLSAVHVNHGLQVQADEWQAHCQKICNRYQVPLLSKAFNFTSSARRAWGHHSPHELGTSRLYIIGFSMMGVGAGAIGFTVPKPG